MTEMRSVLQCYSVQCYQQYTSVVKIFIIEDFNINISLERKFHKPVTTDSSQTHNYSIIVHFLVTMFLKCNNIDKQYNI